MWASIKRFFRDSETLFWARLHVALGAIAAILTYVDPSVLAPIMPAEWFPWFLVGNGLAIEYLRRRRADDLNKPPRDPDWDV